MYAPFELDIPTDLDGALAALAKGGGETVLPIAGGTNLIVDIRAKRERPDRMVASRGRRAARHGLRADASPSWPHHRERPAALARDRPEAPSLIEAARLFGGLMVRNTGTVAGNIASGSPAADLVPPLLVLDAELTLASASATRTLALDDYYLGYKQDARRPDELITRISWLRLPENSANTFYKLARRKGDAITVTGVAVALSVADGTCTRARIALASVAPVVLRAKQAEAVLEGRTLTPALIGEAAEAAGGDLHTHRRHPGLRRLCPPYGGALTRRLVTQA